MNKIILNLIKSSVEIANVKTDKSPQTSPKIIVNVTVYNTGLITYKDGKNHESTVEMNVSEYIGNPFGSPFAWIGKAIKFKSISRRSGIVKTKKVTKKTAITLPI